MHEDRTCDTGAGTHEWTRPGLRVRMDAAGKVEYVKNGKLLYTSTEKATFPLVPASLDMDGPVKDLNCTTSGTFMRMPVHMPMQMSAHMAMQVHTLSVCTHSRPYTCPYTAPAKSLLPTVTDRVREAYLLRHVPSYVPSKGPSNVPSDTEDHVPRLVLDASDAGEVTDERLQGQRAVMAAAGSGPYTADQRHAAPPTLTSLPVSQP